MLKAEDDSDAANSTVRSVDENLDWVIDEDDSRFNEQAANGDESLGWQLIHSQREANGRNLAESALRAGADRQNQIDERICDDDERPEQIAEFTRPGLERSGTSQNFSRQTNN